MASFITTMWAILSLISRLSTHMGPTSEGGSAAPAPASVSFVAAGAADSSEYRIFESDIVYSNARTRGQFKPRTPNKGTSSYQLRQFAEATLGSGSLRKAVKLPEGEDVNEWLAVNVVDFYNQINLLYGSITEFCSPVSCPEMKATDE